MVFSSVLFKTRAMKPEMVPLRAASNKPDFQPFPYRRAGNYHKAIAPSVAKAVQCVRLCVKEHPYNGVSQMLCSSWTPSGGKSKPSEALTSGAGRSGHCSVHKTPAARKLLPKMCTHQKVCGALCARERILSSRQIRRPEERNFKPLCIYCIDSCNKTWSETPTVLIVEMFKVCG